MVFCHWNAVCYTKVEKISYRDMGFFLKVLLGSKCDFGEEKELKNHIMWAFLPVNRIN